MTEAPEQVETTDSDAYSAGMAAGLDPAFVPCPFPAGSRLACLWFSGRDDFLYARNNANKAVWEVTD
jgi:hypothetical protein